MLEKPAGLHTIFAELEIDGLEMRIDPLAACGLQGAEQLVAQRISRKFWSSSSNPGLPFGTS